MTATRKPATKTADGILLDLYRQRDDLSVRLDSTMRALAGEFGDLTVEQRASHEGSAYAYQTVVQQLDDIIESATR